jgi:hypothetical protein
VISLQKSEKGCGHELFQQHERPALKVETGK